MYIYIHVLLFSEQKLIGAYLFIFFRKFSKYFSTQSHYGFKGSYVFKGSANLEKLFETEKKFA